MNRINKVIVICIFGLMHYTASSTGSRRIIWIETENFETRGGWTKDWQFIGQMGSPYLMAIGYGEPVTDAKTTIKGVKPGSYKLWARTKDWVPQFHPGKFEILINGMKSSKIFGASGQAGWLWEEGGTFQIKEDVTLNMHDLTGYYGRCDAIVLSPDTTWIPPSDNNQILALRKQHGVISTHIKDMGMYDVVVVGGGVAGTFAAISAARQGAKTVLIQNRNMLGGNASSEILVPPIGAMQNLLSKEELKLDPRETGLIEEMNLVLKQRYLEVGKYWPDRLKLLAQSEPNLKVVLNTEADSVGMKSKTEISGIFCTEISSGQRMKFNGKIFIDCTGNGTIGLKAGAEYMIGRESKELYNETKAPDTTNNETLGSSLKYWAVKQDKISDFKTPDWIYSYPECSDFGQFKDRHLSVGDIIDKQWVIELGGNLNSYENAEETRDDLLRLVYGIWDHMKNQCTQNSNKDAGYWKLAWVGHVVGIRENYRLVGDYVMSESDITKQPLLEDRVAYGGWGLDDHPSLGFFDKTRLNYHTHGGLLFSIPYRSLYSKNISNLMMAGRNISATHVALSATRVMLTTGTIGQAAGTAAGMCINRNTLPRGIYQNHLSDLQQNLIKDGAYLIDMPNMDINDLALSAFASASSELRPASEAINGFSRVRLSTVFLKSELMLNAWLPDTNSVKPQWLQLSWEKPQKFNVVHIIFQNRGELAAKRNYSGM
jgi:hypothetical protein